jgi:hypothetical protein
MYSIKGKGISMSCVALKRIDVTNCVVVRSRLGALPLDHEREWNFYVLYSIRENKFHVMCSS